MSFSRTVPALPVKDVTAAVAFYQSRFGFGVMHADAAFARLNRDDAQIHLWLAGDSTWRQRPDLSEGPVRSGAEDFIAGTASCRIDVDSADEVLAEMRSADVLHPVQRAAPTETTWGTREVDTLDLDGNLLTFVQRLG